jgi:hypothetical protein
MTFWLRENAGHSKIFAEPFRFTIGRRAYCGSGAGLQIGFGTGKLLARACEAHRASILSKRHPKQRINKGLVGRHLKSASKGTLFPFIASAFQFLFLSAINAVT